MMLYNYKIFILNLKRVYIIIYKLVDYKYWLHWEDSWYSNGPVLKEAFDAMIYTDIIHYQLTQNKVIYDMPIIKNNNIKKYYIIII